jgi:LmbE family N-acetylglucosaminyl deacetylase
MNENGVYLLAISPHPLDTELGIGGTVAALTREGKQVVYVICTNGDKGSSDPQMAPHRLAEMREKEELTAASLLGVNQVLFLRHPDLGLEETPAFRQEILHLILEYRPEVVATCDPYYHVYLSNRDHRVLGRVVLDAVWPAAQAPNTFPALVKRGHAIHKVKEVWLWQSELPNFRRDISATFELKRQAANCHESQRTDPNNPEFGEQIVTRAVAAAKGETFQYGEAFHRLEVLQRL